MPKRKSREEFEKEVFNLVGYEYSVLGEYTGTHNKLLMRHNNVSCCNLEWETTPNSFLRGSRCPECNKISKTKTQEQFEADIFEKLGEKYALLSEYKNSRTKVLMKHNCPNCDNHEYWILPTDILFKNSKCPKCAKSSLAPRKTTEQFKQTIFDLVGEEYSVLGEYVNANTKILMKHNACGHEWNIKVLSFLQGTRCPMCSSTARKTQEKFEKEIFDLVGNEYTVLGEYVNANTKLLMKHNNDSCNNYEWLALPKSFLRGCRCPKCYGTHKKTTEEFKQEVFEKEGNEYIVLGEYVNAHTKIELHHSKCNNSYMVQPCDFITGYRCPYCNDSKGEKAILDYLRRNDINFKAEYKIAECREINPLPFDYAVFDNDNNLKLLIEYQGEQHYHYKKLFHRNIDGFVDRILYDSTKRAYCEYEHIDLLEIPYTKFANIEQILEEKLTEYGLLLKTS
jgi:Zn ribbon nucleic-acid-binding protein